MVFGRAFLAFTIAVGAGHSPCSSQDPPPAPAPPTRPVPGQPATQPARAKGFKVTFESGIAEQRQREGAHSYRARLLSLAVERGETPTPLIAPGYFRATWTGVLPLPARDRFRFRATGRGSIKLSIDGATVLEGVLRPGKPIETADAVRLRKGDNELVCVFESTAQGEGQLRVAWSGSDFGFEPIGPDVPESPAADREIAAGERLRLGHRLFVERRCAHCHELPDQRALGESPYGELDNRGPDLRSVAARVRTDWLFAWLSDPRAIRADARMPKFAYDSPAELANLTAWLATLGVPAGVPQFTGEQAAQGEERFRQLGCIACHVPPGEPPAAAATGGRLHLSFVPQKWHPAALVDYLRDPTRDYPHTRMPDFRLSNEDAQQLAAFLLATRPAPLPAAPAGDPQQGRRVAQQHGCVNCHALDVPSPRPQWAAVANLHPEHGCLGGKPAAPDHGFDRDQLDAVRAFLKNAPQAIMRRSPLDYAARVVPAANCQACHARYGIPSAWAELVDAAGGAPPDQDPTVQRVPALTWLGAKLQPAWMERFVLGKEPSPRPWNRARMPAFVAHGVPITAGLAREHGYAGQDEPEQSPDNQLVAHGQKLVRMGEGFGCVQCHGVGAAPPVQVSETQGVNFAIAARRLRQEYYQRWLADPFRVDPESKMPKYADAKGRTTFTEILGGDAERQFEAIWHWFRSL